MMFYDKSHPLIWIIFQLGFEMIQEWILKNPEASICTPEGLVHFSDVANFQDYHGLPHFRTV